MKPPVSPQSFRTGEPELVKPGEPLVDFCLWEYPPHAPAAGKLRSVNQLFASFEAERMDARAGEVVAAIRNAFGESRTVWGVKQEGGHVSWELYFYDYARLERERSVTRLLAAIRPWVACDVEIGGQNPYFMFSIDLDADIVSGRKPLAEVQMYIGNIGSNVSSGICYAVSRNATRLKNFYFFFDARREMDEIEGKLASSAYLADAGFDLSRVLWPELRDCQTIVVANKPDRDGVYFSRIDATQLLVFLKRLRYPEAHIRYVEQNAGRIDHLLYDVGFDYRLDGEGGELQILKSAYYGVF
jgi:hypothetical protein